MTPAEDGKPLVGDSARTLGVRIPEDARPNDQGMVGPSSAGMSLATCSIWNLPGHRRPVELGNGSSGKSGDRIYALSVRFARNKKLQVHVTHPLHARLEPIGITSLALYKIALSETLEHWRQVWP
jgi:hypothetical protein